MVIRFGAQTDFLDFDGLLRFTGFAFLLGTVIKELAKIHHPANWRFSLGRYFYEVHVPVRRDVERLSKGYYTEVLIFAVWPLGNQTNLTYTANLLIYSIVSSADTIHLIFRGLTFGPTPKLPGASGDYPSICAGRSQQRAVFENNRISARTQI